MSTLPRRPALVFAMLALASAGCGTTDSNPPAPAKDTGLEAQPSKPQKQTTFKPRHFSGNGTSNIGTLRIPADAVLSWRHTPSVATVKFIQIFSEDGELTVMSEAPVGRSALAAGVYPKVAVTTMGDWSITIRPR